MMLGMVLIALLAGALVHVELKHYKRVIYSTSASLNQDSVKTTVYLSSVSQCLYNYAWSSIHTKETGIAHTAAVANAASLWLEE